MDYDSSYNSVYFLFRFIRPFLTALIKLEAYPRKKASKTQYLSFLSKNRYKMQTTMQQKWCQIQKLWHSYLYLTQQGRWKRKYERRKTRIMSVVLSLLFLGYTKRYASSERGFMKKATEHISVDINPNIPYSTAFLISRSFRGDMLNFTKRSTMQKQKSVQINVRINAQRIFYSVFISS